MWARGPAPSQEAVGIWLLLGEGKSPSVEWVTQGTLTPHSREGLTSSSQPAQTALRVLLLLACFVIFKRGNRRFGRLGDGGNERSWWREVNMVRIYLWSSQRIRYLKKSCGIIEKATWRQPLACSQGAPKIYLSLPPPSAGVTDPTCTPHAHASDFSVGSGHLNLGPHVWTIDFFSLSHLLSPTSLIS